MKGTKKKHQYAKMTSTKLNVLYGIFINIIEGRVFLNQSQKVSFCFRNLTAIPFVFKGNSDLRILGYPSTSLVIHGNEQPQHT